VAVPPQADQLKGNRRGRWRSGERSRRRILSAAIARFARDGFDRTTLRAIAADARVDPAEIHYFFQTKELLFAAAMQSPEAASRRVHQMLDEGIHGFAARLLAYLLQAWDTADDVDPLIALFRSAPTHAGSAIMLRELVHAQIGARLAELLGTGDVQLRLGLFSAQLIGVLHSRYILRLEPIASADRELLIAWLSPVMQGYLTGPRPSTTTPATPHHSVAVAAAHVKRR
jgi:AcrR family transcriptional regulator